jgi:hypothetical protein
MGSWENWREWPAEDIYAMKKALAQVVVLGGWVDKRFTKTRSTRYTGVGGKSGEFLTVSRVHVPPEPCMSDYCLGDRDLYDEAVAEWKAFTAVLETRPFQWHAWSRPFQWHAWRDRDDLPDEPDRCFATLDEAKAAADEWARGKRWVLV